MSARPIILIVREREKRDGIFDCHHDGRYLCSSPSPFIDGCRHLLAQGYDPTARVVRRHAGSEDDALRGVLGRVAGVEIGSHGVGLQRRRERGTASHVRSPGVAAGTVPREPPSAPTHVRPHGPVSYIPTSEDALTPSGSS